MSVLEKIAYFQNRRDEVPNQELARQLQAAQDQAGIEEIAQNLWNQNSAIQSDCLKVLYEIGALEPALVAEYAPDFLRLLGSKNNRLVWGAMIALGNVAALKAGEVFAEREVVFKAMGKGSVITVDNGVKALAQIAAQKDEYRAAILPYLIHHLQTCRPKDVPQHAEKAAVAVNAATRREFVDALEKRLGDLSASQASRVKKVIRDLDR
jgi:hypothetical protein